MTSLRDKVTIITGASSGIGAGIATHFARCGAKLVLTGRDADRLQQVVADCEQTGLNQEKIHQVLADLSTDDGMQKVIKEAISYFGRLDILINNAGIPYIPNMEQSDMERVDDLMAINLRTPYNMMRLAIPELKKTKGTIVNISSASTLRVFEFAGPAYNASKAGLNHLSRCAASELGPFGVRVNCVIPGPVKTPVLVAAGCTSEAADVIWNACAAMCALGRVGTVDDIAKVVAFIASDDASFMTGACVPVDGGYSIKG